ncbi:MAG: VOC family protein [Frankiaceae bacterium]
MPQITSYEPGTPSWVDLGTTDTEAARSFYRRLFGWDYEIGGPGTMGYALCRLRGLTVAGVWELMPDMLAAGVPPNWMTYFSTDALDGSIKRITDSAGSVLSGPMDIMEQGRMAIASDPTGAAFGLWEPAAHIGAELVNEPGAVIWNELLSRDEATAVPFYTDVFGFTTESVDLGGVTRYVILKIHDRPVGGLTTMPPQVPEGVPSYWATCFAVTDADVSVRLATDAGGSVIYGPVDSPQGRVAVLADPQGAAFSVLGVGEPAL